VGEQHHSSGVLRQAEVTIEHGAMSLNLETLMGGVHIAFLPRRPLDQDQPDALIDDRPQM
jgi:hypothetical protein